MSDESTNGMAANVNRRRFVQGVGATGIAGLAGCTGGGGDGGDGGDGGGSAGTQTGTSGSSEWPDLSGKDLHFLNSDNSEESQNYWNAVTKAFADATGANVNMEFTGIGTSHEQRITQLLQAGDPPELDWITPAYASTAAYQDAMADLTPAIDFVREQYGDPHPQGRVVIDGKDRIFPTAVAGGQVWYRQDLSSFSEVPNTWDKYQSYVEASHEADEPRNGAYIPTGQGSHAMSHHLSWAYSNDARVCTRKNGEVTCHIADGTNRKRWVETLDYLNTLHDSSPVSTDSSWSALINAIQNGTAATNWYSGVRPKNHSISNERPFAEQVSNMKVGTPLNNGNMTRAGGNGIGSFKGGDTEAAIEFLKFWATRSEDHPTMRDLPFAFAPNHNVLAWPEAVASDWYLERSMEATSDAWTEEQAITALREAPKNMLNFVNETGPPNPFAGSIYASNKIQDMVAEACVDDTDPEQLVDKYQQEVNKVIEESK